MVWCDLETLASDEMEKIEETEEEEEEEEETDSEPCPVLSFLEGSPLAVCCPSRFRCPPAASLVAASLSPPDCWLSC